MYVEIVEWMTGLPSPSVSNTLRMYANCVEPIDEAESHYLRENTLDKWGQLTRMSAMWGQSVQKISIVYKKKIWSTKQEAWKEINNLLKEINKGDK